MKKWLKVTLFTVLGVLVGGGIGVYAYLQWLKPTYNGSLDLPGLAAPVEVLFDTYGVPHIYAQTETDAQYALGYLHAQERLFQMEMIRRVAEGRLSEFLGEPTLKFDRYFRTLGIHQHAQELAKTFFANPQEPHQQLALAYLRGVNDYVKHGKTPIEFTMLGIEKAEFTPTYFFDMVGYMAVGFADGFRTDPDITHVRERVGDVYMRDLVTHWNANDRMIPTDQRKPKNILNELAATLKRTSPQTAAALLDLESLPTPLLHGSNSWVLSPQKTASGKVLFSNDAHIGYAQPCVWFEAHIETPTFSVYGNYLAGLPFPVIGHTRQHAWGITMFENDDVNLYREDGAKAPLWISRNEVIKVKGKPDTTILVQIAPHGPVMNDVLPALDTTESKPISVWWTFLQTKVDLMSSLYEISHGKTLAQVRMAASTIAAPGLNIMYGDADGNVAWWASARIPKFSPEVDPIYILDGTNPNHEPMGWYDFSENPQSENPAHGYVYSANNQPAPVNGVTHYGYFAPESRSRRITDALDKAEKWTIEDSKKLVTDVVGFPFPKNAQEVAKVVTQNAGSKPLSAAEQQFLQTLSAWNGDHQTADIAPTMYYKLIWHVLHGACADEMGDSTFKELASTFLMQRTTPALIPNDSSLWWDNVNTPEKETRAAIFREAVRTSVEELTAQLGADMAQWQWGKVHTLTHVHPIGRQKPFDKVFNVGPMPAPGGKEVLNNIGFSLSPDGEYPARYGPSKRIQIDFADVEHAISVLPTGQSGYFLSPHYNDQAALYVQGKFRPMLMNRKEIEAAKTGRLELK